MKNNILKYIPLLMMLLTVSCTNDDALVGGNPSSEITPEPEKEQNPKILLSKVSTQDFVFGDTDEYDQLTRGALYYDFGSNTMKFSWQATDAFGAFPNEEQYKDQQLKFVISPGTITSDENNTHSEAIITGDDPDAPPTISPNKSYLSYGPYVEQTESANFNYEEVPVTYSGQTQAANIKMKYYYLRNTGTDEEKAAALENYVNSEKAAAAHLGAYDYLVSNTVSTTNGVLHFEYTRMGSIIRFLLRSPNKEYFDSLQVVTNKSKFTINAKMNVKEQSFVPTSTSKVQSMAFNPAIDMTGDEVGNVDNDYQYYRNVGFIVAYMMLAPIDLSEDDTYLYLCGHTKDGVKTYYKSTSLLKKYNFEANKNYQWTVQSKADEPITFTKVTVQEWQSAVFANNGKGTEKW